MGYSFQKPGRKKQTNKQNLVFNEDRGWKPEKNSESRVDFWNRVSVTLLCLCGLRGSAERFRTHRREMKQFKEQRNESVCEGVEGVRGMMGEVGFKRAVQA